MDRAARALMALLSGEHARPGCGFRRPRRKTEKSGRNLRQTENARFPAKQSSAVDLKKIQDGLFIVNFGVERNHEKHEINRFQSESGPAAFTLEAKALESRGHSSSAIALPTWVSASRSPPFPNLQTCPALIAHFCPGLFAAPQ